MAATLDLVVAVGYTFGVLTFLRSLRKWRLGLREEREGGQEWEVDGRSFKSRCCGAACFK